MGRVVRRGRWAPLWRVLLLAMVLAGGCQSATPAVHLDGPQYGIQTFLWWYVDNKTAWRDADLVQGLDFGWMKEEFAWGAIWGSRGGYDWFRPHWIVKLAEERHLKVLARLDKAPFWALA